MKKFSILMLALLGLCWSCSKPNDVPDTPNTPVNDPTSLVINENLVTVKAVGEECAFTYTMEGGSTENLVVKSEDEWIHDFDISTAGVVRFIVDANPLTKTRLSKITISCGKLKDDVVVSQSGITQEDFKVAFDVTYDIDGPYVTMSVVPDPEQIRYYAWYYSKKGMETALEQSPGVTIEMYLKRVVEVDISNAIYYGSYAGYTAEEAVAELTFVGPASQKFELNAETDFYGFVCAVSDGGTILSDITITEFRTGSVAPSDNQLGIIINDVNTDRISYSVTTTNNDQYATLIFSAEDIEGLSDEEIVAKFNETEDYVNYLHFGDISDTIIVDSEDTDYYIVAFGFEYGMATTEIVKEKVHTLKSDGSPLSNVNITLDKVTHYRIKATVEAEPKTSLYYVDWCYTEESAEELKELVRESAQWFVDEGYYSHISDCMRVICSKGKTSVEFVQLSPNTDYRLFVIGVDELTGEFNTDVIFTDIITTPAIKTSESYIEIKYDKYFDGYDLMDVYPEEFSDADGWAVVPLEVTTHGDVVDYFYDIYIGDLTAANGPTDSQLILDLTQYGRKNEPIAMSYCYFYEPLTLVYFSKDGDDNNSPVVRIPLTLTPDGCSSVSEFDYMDEVMVKSMCIRNFGE